MDGLLLRLDTLGLRIDGARLLLHHRLDLRLHRRRCHQLRGGLRLRLNDLALRLRLDSCDDPALRLLLLRLGLCNLSLELGLRLDNSLRLRLHDLRMHGLGLYGLRLQLRLAGERLQLAGERLRLDGLLLRRDTLRLRLDGAGLCLPDHLRLLLNRRCRQRVCGGLRLNHLG